MPQYYLLNKPRGCVTARSDALHSTVLDLFPSELRRILHPVGRLDLDTEGLLLLTDDGALDRFLLRPEQHVMKEYLFLAFGTLSESDAEKMSAGVVLPGSGFVTAACSTRILSRSSIGECRSYLPADRAAHFMKNPHRPVTCGEICICEGHKHQVRLMVKAAGGHVFYLRRTAIGQLRLPPGLLPGQYRPLTQYELETELGYGNSHSL